MEEATKIGICILYADIVHVMLMFVPKISMDSSYILNIAVYSVVFLGYAICRVIKAVSVKNGDLVKAV